MNDFIRESSGAAFNGKKPVQVRVLGPEDAISEVVRKIAEVFPDAVVSPPVRNLRDSGSRVYLNFNWNGDGGK